MKMPFHFEKYLAGGLVFLALACQSRGETSAESTSQNDREDNGITVSHEQFETNGMALGALSQRPFPEILRVSGSIDVPPENRAVVSAISGGFVREITLLVGDRVRQGQRIAVLESPDYVKLQQEYLETQARLPYLKGEYDRLKILLAEEITSEKAFLDAESQYKMALAQYSSLRRQLELLHIEPPQSAEARLNSRSPVYAPIEGAITKVNVRKGAYVSPASEIVEIVNREHLHLELQVYEKDVSKLEKGQVIQFRAPELSDTVYQAEVYLIGTALDENRTVQVHAHLASEDHDDFLVGMFIRADILLEREGESNPLMAVPEEALVTEGGQSYLLFLEAEGDTGYRFQKVAVRVATTAEGFAAITAEDTLPAGQKVLVKGAFGLVGRN